MLTGAERENYHAFVQERGSDDVDHIDLVVIYDLVEIVGIAAEVVLRGKFGDRRLEGAYDLQVDADPVYMVVGLRVDVPGPAGADDAYTDFSVFHIAPFLIQRVALGAGPALAIISSSTSLVASMSSRFALGLTPSR